ncbi:MAG: hypothetical protein AAF430_04575 [Myxococcota bacterium]
MPRSTLAIASAAGLLGLACASPAPSTRSTPAPTTVAPGGSSLAALTPAGSGHAAFCGGRWIDVTAPVNAISADFEAQRLAYDRSRMQDCSGMLHQVLRRFEAEYCPEAAGAFPDPSRWRSSDGIAAFYASRGLFTVVDSGAELRNAEALRPGSIVFYGSRHQRYTGLSPQEAAAVVSHVGIVTSVVRGPEGVQSYAIFHGRRVGRPAAVTNYHVRQPRNGGSPPFGNGRQQWVGWAPLLPGR